MATNLFNIDGLRFYIILILLVVMATLAYCNIIVIFAASFS